MRQKVELSGQIMAFLGMNTASCLLHHTSQSSHRARLGTAEWRIGVYRLSGEGQSRIVKKHVGRYILLWSSLKTQFAAEYVHHIRPDISLLLSLF